MTETKFYVITGGPGAGKTTVITHLKRLGYACINEGARMIIQEQMANGGDALPWDNVHRFKEKILAHAIESYDAAPKHQITFFDRSIFDLIAYDRRTKTTSSAELEKAIQWMSYRRLVFIAPPWEEIFCNDNERKQTFLEAVDVYQSIQNVYKEWGFDLIELPKSSVNQRVEFILNHVNRDL